MKYWIQHKKKDYHAVMENDDGEVIAQYFTYSREDAENWMAIETLAHMISEATADLDDEVQDTLESILILIYGLNIEGVDLDNPNDLWVKMEDYVLSMMPQAFRRLADKLEQEQRNFYLDQFPVDPRKQTVPPLDA